MNVKEADPIDVVAAALSVLPDDPAAATSRDLPALDAAFRALAGHALDLRRGLYELAARLDDPAPDQTGVLLAENARLHAREAALRRAGGLLETYAAAALAACGHDLDHGDDRRHHEQEK